MSRLLLSILLLLPLGSWAQSSIYKTTDEHGNVVFTDAPPATSGNAERVEIEHINTTPPPPSIPEAAPAQQEEEKAPARSVTISDPADETTIPHGPGNFSVTASVSGDLLKNESLQLFLDGTPHGEPQRGPVWQLTNIFRGAHELTVAIVDHRGNTVARSDAITVFVHRPSVN